MSKVAFDPYQQWLGIPPGEHPVDHYRLLGLSPLESDPQVILRAADERMAHVRTFQSGRRAEESQRLLNEIAAAKTCLLDPATKATYDAVLQGQWAARHHAGTATLQRSTPAQPSGGSSSPAAELSTPTPLPPPPPLAHPPTVKAAVQESIPSFSPDDERPPASIFPPWLAGAVIAGVCAMAVFVVAVFLVLLGRKGTNPATTLATSAGDPPAETAFVEDEPNDDFPAIEQQADGSIDFPAASAILSGNARSSTQGGRTLVTGITSPDDRITWHFHIDTPGAFRIEATYATEAGQAGGQFIVTAGDQKSKVITTRETGGPGSFTSERVGHVWVRKSGLHELVLEPVQIPAGGSLMQLEALRMTPLSGTTQSR